MTAIGGHQMSWTLDHFEQACTVHVEEEQAKANPDSALIALLCEAVRLKREYAGVIIDMRIPTKAL